MKRTYTFVEVYGNGLDSLTVAVDAHVIVAENEKEAWIQLLGYDLDEPQQNIDDNEGRVPGVRWDSDHQYVTILKLIPQEPGQYSLSWATNG